MSGFRRSRRLLRATLVAIAVLVLVPAWMARVTYLYACPSDGGEVKKTRCCGGTAKKQTDPVARRACCDVDEVDLGASRAPSAAHDVPALTPPDAVELAVVSSPPLVPSEAAQRPAQRATGPPPYLRNLTLLL